MTLNCGGQVGFACGKILVQKSMLYFAIEQRMMAIMECMRWVGEEDSKLW